MRIFRLLLAILAVWMVAAAAPTAGVTVQPGNYAITYRLEMPHLERYSVERTKTVCIKSEVPHLPVLGAKAAFEECEMSPVARIGATLSYRLVCEGRAGARAHASHRFASDGFTGRISIVLGAKNMTMVEVQSARRMGDCSD